MILCTLVLSSCGDNSVSDNPAKIIGNTSAASPLSAPPIAGERPGATPSGPTLQPPRGINTANLFPADLKKDTDRIDRLETAVQSLRNDFDAMAPAITRLTAVEGDLQELVSQLETLLEETEPAPPPAGGAPMALTSAEPPGPPQEPEMEPAPASPPPAKKAMAGPPGPTPPTKSTGGEGTSVIDIRVGEHPDKTRIVLDIQGSSPFTHDLDNTEKILIVELPNAKWAATPQKTYADSALLLSHRTDSINNGAGTRLILRLKSPAAVIYSGSIKGKRNGEQRIVLDLGPDHSASPTQ